MVIFLMFFSHSGTTTIVSVPTLIIAIFDAVLVTLLMVVVLFRISTTQAMLTTGIEDALSEQLYRLDYCVLTAKQHGGCGAGVAGEGEDNLADVRQYLQSCRERIRRAPHSTLFGVDITVKNVIRVLGAFGAGILTSILRTATSMAANAEG